MVSFKIIFGVLFGLVVATITALTFISYQNNKASLETAQLVRYTHDVLDQVEEIESLIKEIQLESNTYFVNQDSSIILSYMAAKEEIYRRIGALKNMTSDNLRQQSRIDSLALTVDDLIAFANSGVIFDSQHSIANVDKRIVSSSQFRRQVRGLVHAIRDEEARRLIQREDAYRSSVAAFNKTSLLLLIVIGILLAATFFVVRYNFNRRIRVQDDLRKANELFVNLFYESPIAIAISNLDTGVIIDCNKGYTNLLGFSKSELLGKTAMQLGILVGEQERSSIVEPARRKNGVHEVEVQLKPKNSEPIWVSISMQRIQINNEDCLLSAILDMTVHKQAEEKMKQALVTEMELNKLKSNFVTLASHEFRTPLTA
ncbi:MAG TPA: PAS domain-containing protein, partial [Chryseosolibacter sp.]|nr:PAS domain-containing protein [Chryseosolibacter sp.]